MRYLIFHNDKKITVDGIHYKNGNCDVFLDTHTGTKVRITNDDYYDEEFPESIDIKITNRCDKGCLWCHEDSKIDGKNADINQSFIDSLHAGQEIAIGGGNVLEHPKLVEFLVKLKLHGCFPSITLNQTHFINNIELVKELISNNLIHGLGISLVDPTDEFIEIVQSIPNAIIHVIVGIITEEQLDKLKNRGLKLLFLGYKTIRRGIFYAESDQKSSITKNTKYLADNFSDILYWFKDGCIFDNLAVYQLPFRETIGEDYWNNYYMGDDGQHTFYIDMVEKQYAVSSSSTTRFDIGDKNIIDMFNHVKEISRKS